MDDFVRVIFQNAIFKERRAKKMYFNLAEKSNSKIIKKIFMELSAEEALHENLFSKMNLNVLKIINNSKLSEVNLLKEIDINNETDLIKSIDELNNVLDYAINEEQKAYDDYNLLLNHLDFGEARDTLKEIATQEKRHKTILQKIKLELTKNDWKVIK
jgi:rubrerythrin